MSATLLFTSALPVSSQTTLGDLVMSELPLQAGINGVVPDTRALDALMDEIWSADPNRHLRRRSAEGSRGHVPAGDPRTRALELFPEEWIYLPVMEAQSPGWELQKLDIGGADTSSACTLVAEWANENAYMLPPKQAALQDDAKQTIDADTLEGYLFNSVLRSGDTAEVVYFYASPLGTAVVDAPPSTPAGGESQTNGYATPGWLVGFWHYIDRLRAEAALHCKHYEDLHELVADGKFVVAVLQALDRMLSLYEREKKLQAPAAGFFDRILEDVGLAASPDQGFKLDVAELQRQVGSLQAQAKDALVDHPAYPAVAQFAASIARLKAIETEAGFKALYEAFDAERDKYPVTEQAFQMACADYVMARVLDPQGDEAVDGLLDAFLEGKAGTSPVVSEIASLFSGKTVKHAIGEAAAVTAMSIGNAPGPSTLWVALTKLGFLREMRKIMVTPKAPRRSALVVLQDYVERLAHASGVPEDVLRKWEADRPGSQTPSAQARATAVRVKAAKDIAERAQSGPGFLKLLSLVNVYAFYSALASARKDRGLQVASDGTSAGAAGSGLTADVFQLLATTESTSIVTKGAALFDMALTSSEAVLMLKNVGAVFGWAASIAGATCGAIEIAQGVRDDDWDNIVAGSGSVAISVGWWADTFITQRAALLVAEEGIGEVGALVVGETVLLGLGSALTVGGILLTAIALAASNKRQVMAVAYALFTPGPQKFVDAVLEQLGKSRAVALGPEDLRGAVTHAKSVAASSTFVTWPIRPETEAQLRSIGLGDDDVHLLRSIPTRLGTPAYGGL